MQTTTYFADNIKYLREQANWTQKTADQLKCFPMLDKKGQFVVLLVAAHYKVSLAKLLGHSNKPQHADPRRVCWWLLYKWCNMTHDDIAAIFNERQRSSITLGIRYINKLGNKHPLFQEALQLDAYCEDYVDPTTKKLLTLVLRLLQRRVA